MFDDLFTAADGELSEVGSLRSALLDALFERMPIGIAVLDRNYTLLRVNPTWIAYLERYAPLNTPQVMTGSNLFDLFPGEEARFAPELEESFGGKVVRREALSLERDGVVSYWDVVLTPLRRDGLIWALLVVVVDASDRVFANRLLEEKEAQYRGIFEATSDGVMIISGVGAIVEANPAACAMHGYSYTEIIGMDGARLFSPAPFAAALEHVLNDGAVDLQAVNRRKSGEPFDVEIRATSFTYRGEPHMLAVVRDVTERAQAYQLLEQRVEERTRELSTLLKASNNITSMLALEPLLNKILDEMQSVINYSGAAIYTLDGGEKLDLLIYRGQIPQAELRRQWSLTRDPAFGAAIHRASPVIVTDVSADTPLARAYRASAGEYVRYVRSWMGIPLIVRQTVVGMLGFDSDSVGHFTPHQADLALAFANQAAAAMDNARLYAEEKERRLETEQRRRVAEGLRDILTIINSNRPIGEILDYVVGQAGRLLGTDSIAIFELEHERGLLTVQTSIGLDPALLRSYHVSVGRGAIGVAVAERRPVIVTDLTALDVDENLKPMLSEWAKHFNTVLAAPMVARDQVYGGMVLYYPNARSFTEEEVGLVMAVCDQATLAIENARLRAEAEQAAVAAERSRLARDLHDAVTQTLFSASLIAEVLPRLWERDREEGLRRLADLRQLTRGALAEMRTLLLELRPATLVEVELRDLLRQLGEAFAGRTRIPVTVNVTGQRPLPPDVQIAFYRVTQEALNNIFKHAQATAVTLDLNYESECVCLTISDNGQGFDPSRVAADSLGLHIMHERAEGIGASFDVTSQPGTRIAVCWPQRKC